MPRTTCSPRLAPCTGAILKVVKKTITKTITKTTEHARPAIPIERRAIQRRAIQQRSHIARRPPPTPPRKSSGCAPGSQLHECAGGASACTPAADVLVVDAAGETTDDGTASPILCMRGGLTGGRKSLVDTGVAADADADEAEVKGNANANAKTNANANTNANTNSAADADADNANANANTTSAADADAANAGAVTHDVFDSQGRRFHGPALEGTNILRLVELAWFREECDYTLRARLGHHDRDAFDLVSKYVLALKARYFRARCLFVFVGISLCGLQCDEWSPVPLTAWCTQQKSYKRAFCPHLFALAYTCRASRKRARQKTSAYTSRVHTRAASIHLSRLL